MSETPEPGARRALLIGIDDYQHEHISKLKGCVNDVRLMKTILEETFGFPPENVTKIENEEATREKLLATLDRFVAETGANDIVVIHYAGHGSLMTDREGDEPSGYDSTIMPIDSPGWRGDNKDISDDEIHLRLTELAKKTPYTTLIFDCCHSGTITRDDFGEAARFTQPDTRRVNELPESPIPKEQWSGLTESGPSGWMPLEGKYVLMAGCRDEEVSYEYRPPEGDGNVVHGALTYFLTNELRQARSGMTYRDVFERAAARVNANNQKQHPQMEGTADREIFGVRTLEPMRFFRVRSREGDTVELGAGAALGMTQGSKFEIHPQGTKSTDEGNRLGEVEVTEVRATTSDARIIEETTPDAIVADTRAFETEHAYGTFSLDVQIVGGAEHEAAVSALRERMGQSQLVTVVGADAPAALRIYALSPRAEAQDSDPVPQLGPLDSAVWAAVRTDGELAMPKKRLEDVDSVLANLEKLARYRQALELDNPDPDSQLKGKFSLELLRETPDGEWIEATPDAESGQIVYHVGERIAFLVRSHQDKDEEEAFTTLIDFGLSGKVGVIHPAKGAAEKLRVGGFYKHGLPPKYNFRLGFPKEFPFAEGGGATEGVETIKLVVTSNEVDLHFLEQAGVRGAGEERKRSAFEALWDTAVKGQGTRDIYSVPVKEEDWTTVTRSFVLREKQTKSLSADGTAVDLVATKRKVFDDKGADGEVREVPAVRIRADGMTGVVEVHSWKSSRAKAVDAEQDALSQALTDASVDVRRTIDVAKLEETPSGTRSGGAPSLELSLREPGPGFGQMLLTADESGALSWHFASPSEGAGTRGGDEPGALRTYTIVGAPRRPAPTSAQRGLMGAAGRKLLKELVFPLIDPVVGAVTNTFVGSWEGRNRPYRVRSFSPDDYGKAEGGLVDGDRWQQLAGGRALLLVHGTFSRAHSAFGGMPRDFVESLHTQYGGRVFALDHYTLSHDPKKNVAWFLEQIPADSSLDLDIICHSRGGLVSRVLTEKQSEFSLGSRQLRIGKVVFVGTPNGGTILADASHIGDLIDTFTNLANFVPDVGVSDTIAGVIAVAKQLAVGAVGGLPGLQSMVPGGKFAAELNAGERVGDTRYFALSSNFTATDPGLAAFAKDRLMDLIFRGGKNDLVVPTEGVFADNGSPFFPIEDHLVLEDAQSVAHTAYFGSSGVREKILEWLGG